MNNIDLEEKTYTTYKKRGFPYFSVGMIVVGAAMLIGGAAYYKTSDHDKYINANMTTVAEEIDLGKTKSVEINVSAGKLEICRSDDGKVHLDGKVPKNYVLKESGGTLRVDLSKSFFIDFDFMNMGTTDAVLYLPDAEYDRFDIESGAGEIKISDLNCDTASFEAGAGELTIDSFKCKGKVDADIGAGELSITNANTGELDVDVGTGEFSFSGEVNGDIDVDCGVGECNIALTNDKAEYEKKYTVNTDTGIGETKVTFNN
jgi:DUF4097 and DUF4098 domain-containing protein YvlB